MVTLNLLTPVGLHNIARAKVMYYVYMNSDGPRYQTLPEAVVVKFKQLDPDMPEFIEDYPGSVAITSITIEWEKPFTF